MMEVANTLKSNIPLQNLWYSKLIVDRMLYSKMQNMIDPDYLPRTQQRLENLGNSYWWDLSGIKLGALGSFYCMVFERRIKK